MSADKPNSTDAWADVLAGRVPSAPLGAADRAIAEGLRAVILARDAKAAEQEAPLSQADAEARAKRRDAFLATQGIAMSGVADVSPVAGGPTHGPSAGIFSRWLPASNQARFAMAAGLAAIAIALPLAVMFERGGNDPLGEDGVPGMRGKAYGGAALKAGDPAAKAQEIERVLVGVGAATRRYQRDGLEVIEAKIGKDRLPAAREALKPFSAAVPDNGIVIITIGKP